MDDSADLGEAEAPRVAVEQSGTERLLQCQDMLANPCPRQSQFPCSNGKAVMGDDFDKNRHAGEAVHESLRLTTVGRQSVSRQHYYTRSSLLPPCARRAATRPVAGGNDEKHS